MILMKGVLLHGGFGTRLRPLTHTGPKQLVRVAGKPVSEWCLEDLRDSGVCEVAVILGELAPLRVVDFYGDGGGLGLKFKLTYVYQGYPYGLAHAVYIAKDFVGDETFVVYLGDNLLIDGIKQFVGFVHSATAPFADKNPFIGVFTYPLLNVIAFPTFPVLLNVSVP